MTTKNKEIMLRHCWKCKDSFQVSGNSSKKYCDDCEFRLSRIEKDNYIMQERRNKNIYNTKVVLPCEKRK